LNLPSSAGNEATELKNVVRALSSHWVVVLVNAIGSSPITNPERVESVDKALSGLLC
jgi:hypothetical protein